MEAQVKGVVRMMDYQVTNIQRAYKDVFTLTSLALKLKKKKNKKKKMSTYNVGGHPPSAFHHFTLRSAPRAPYPERPK